MLGVGWCGQEASNFPGFSHHLKGVLAESATRRWKPGLLMFVPTQK